MGVLMEDLVMSATSRELKVENYSSFNDFEKEEIIKAYIPLVKRVVHRLAGRMPKDIELKEMINSGMIGLVDALEKYDPKMETNFATYAQFRIRGAILDSFRAQDWMPRTLRHKAHKIEKAYMIVEQQLGRAASDREVAAELGLELTEFNRQLSEVSNTVMYSFDELGFGHGDERFQSEEHGQSKSPNPLDALLLRERVSLIARALDRLPSKERLVTTLYFYEELNLKEIGDILNVTESRASQIRTRALIRLKNYLKGATH